MRNSCPDGCGRLRPTAGWLFAAGILAFWLGVAARSVVAQQLREAGRGEAKWETLEGCRLVPGTFLDGDSFHVMHGEREYGFRLYFVDAPETDAALAERVQDQALYFGIAVADVPRAGELAARFTRALLETNRFTVLTRWQNAMGRGRLARFYAVVLLDEKNLAEELVANGLARIHGLRANWPGGPRSSAFINKLKNLELTAREQQRGVWNTNLFPRVSLAELDRASRTNASAAPSAKTPRAPRGTPSRSGPPSERLDLNRAGAAELEQLPGIGPKLAERIIANRPFKSVEDLKAVPGIGPKTLEKLRPLVRVEPPQPAP